MIKSIIAMDEPVYFVNGVTCRKIGKDGVNTRAVRFTIDKQDSATTECGERIATLGVTAGVMNKAKLQAC